MSVVPDGFGEVTINMDFVAGPSNPMAIVFGYSHAGVNPSGHASVIANSLIASINTINVWSNNLLYLSVDAFENPGGVSGSATVGITGTAGEAALPPQVSVLIRKHTATGGAAGRGRMYWPGLTVAQVLEGGYIVGSSVVLMQEEFDDFLGSIAGADLPMHLLHGVGGPAPSLVTSLAVQVILATQRRRIR